MQSFGAETTGGRKLQVMVMGLGRGMGHVQALLTLPDVEIAYLAEVDPKRLAAGLKAVSDKQATACEGVKDFRRVLEDRRWTRSSSPHRIFGTHLPHFSRCRRANMFMSRSPAAKTRTRRR